MIRITKINWEIPNEIVFLHRLHTEKNDEAFSKLLISKKLISKSFLKDLLNFYYY